MAVSIVKQLFLNNVWKKGAKIIMTMLQDDFCLTVSQLQVGAVVSLQFCMPDNKHQVWVKVTPGTSRFFACSRPFVFM